MRLNILVVAGAAAATLALAGCAGDGQSNTLTTASVTKPKAVEKLDPACVALNQKIAQIRAEGTPTRLGEVAKGKTKVARVKRASIAKMAELDRLNWEFQGRCSKYPLHAARQAAQTKPVTPNAAAAVAKAAGAAKKPKVAATAAQPIVAVPKQ